MRYALLRIALSVLPAAARAEGRLGYVTYGPMLHWNFSAYRFSDFSLGFECAYWNYARTWEEGFYYSGPMPDTDRPGLGIALGVDGGRNGFRLYAEPQLGWVLAGLSLGPVLEVSAPGASVRWGIQGSGWINALGRPGHAVSVRGRAAYPGPGPVREARKAGFRPRRSSPRSGLILRRRRTVAATHFGISRRRRPAGRR